MMSSLSENLTAIFRDVEIARADENQLVVSAPAEAAVPILAFLKENGYTYLQLVSCVDWIERDEFELVYFLTEHGEGPGVPRGGHRGVELKVVVARGTAQMNSAIRVFPIAEPYEREIHELFGVHFDGHPRLTHLFLDRDYDIPPFRKDFDTAAYVSDVFESIPPVDEEG